LMIIDLITTNEWERPIYFNNTSRQGVNLVFDDYLIQEGQAYRLLPIKNPGAGDFVNTDIMYENLMNNFHYRELDNPEVYYNEDYRNFVLNQRSSFNTLTEALIQEGKESKASEVIHASLTRMPNESIPYDYTGATTVMLLFRLGELEKAKEIAAIMANKADLELQYYLENSINIGLEIQKSLMILQNISRTMDTYGESELAETYNTMVRTHYDALQIFDRKNR